MVVGGWAVAKLSPAPYQFYSSYTKWGVASVYRVPTGKCALGHLWTDLAVR